MSRRQVYFNVVLLVLIISLTGCGENPNTPPVLTTITFSPASVSVQPGNIYRGGQRSKWKYQ